MKRLHRVLAAVSVAMATLAAVVTAAPASASTAEGYVAGTGIVTDDWGDEGTLSRTSHAYSGATGLWQTVLYLDGAIERDGTPFDVGDIDCNFGPNTEYATRNWQRTHGVGVDGIVGRQTFGAADNKLELLSDGKSVLYRGRAQVRDIGTRSQFPGTYWYTIDIIAGQGANYIASYSPPLYTPAPGAPTYACWG